MPNLPVDVLVLEGVVEVLEAADQSLKLGGVPIEMKSRNPVVGEVG